MYIATDLYYSITILSFFSNDVELDVCIATWRSKIFTMHVYVHLNMVEFWHVKLRSTLI